MNHPPDWRSRQRAATNRRIYETAMRLFEEHGFEQISVSRIASESGVSVPTFYAHFAGKEQVVMRVPSAEEVAAALAEHAADLPLGERIRRTAPLWYARLDAEGRAELLARWKIIARTPSLRLRAGEFERTTAARVLEALPPADGSATVPVESVVATAHVTTLTTAFLAWAESDGERDLDDVVEEAFRALRQS